MPYEQPGVMLSSTIHTNKERQANESIEVDHEYEVLDKYTQAYEDIQVLQTPPPKQKQQQSSSASDYELTQCSAYISVAHDNQQNETSLLQPTTASFTDSEVTAADGNKGQDKSGTDDDQQSQSNGTYETVGLS